MLLSAAPLAAQGGPVPRPAGDISIQLPTGQVVTPAAFRGKVLALSFILTT